MLKNLLNDVHDVVHQAVHIVLILPVAGLKGVISLLTHLLKEIEQV